MVDGNSLLVLKALSDETRLNILELLLDGEKCVCEIFPRAKRTQPTVSHQLAKLEEAGIVSSRRDGKKIYYKIKDLRVCDIFKALGFKKSSLSNNCHCTKSGGKCK
jgi:DNA-binding transcriptional ArsR family regulator